MKKFAYPNNYAICPNCKRGIGVSLYGKLRRHHAGRSKKVCKKSGKHFR